MVDPDPKDNNDDNWQKVVRMLTGYEVPAQDKVFEHLKGNDGIPLMHVRLDKVGGPEYQSGFISSGGWQTHNTDYTIPFYRPNNDGDAPEGRQLYRYRAHITMLGIAKGSVPSGDDVLLGVESTSKVLKDKGGWNKEGENVKWDNNALVQYVHGSRAALLQLTLYPYSTHGFADRGISVPDDNYVDLGSFTDAARSFDRVVKFFEESALTVGKWDTEDIGEGSKSWDGTPAAIFKALIHKLARNYEGYADQINGKDAEGASTTLDGTVVNSMPAQALAAAQWELYNQAQALLLAWQAWKATSNPHRWLYDMLQNARLTLFDTQYDKTDISTVGAGRTYRNVVVAEAGFANDIMIDGKSYGSPSEMDTWKKIGAEAVHRWEQSVKDSLSVAGADAIVAISKALGAAQDAFDPTITDKDKQSLSDIASKEEIKKEKEDAKKEAEAAKAEAKKEKEDAKKEYDDAKAEAKKEKEDAKAEAAKEKEEAKKENDAAKEEAKKEKEEAKAEAAKEKEEAKRENDAAKEEANKEKEEAKKENEAAKEEAKKEKEEAKAEAASQRAFALAQAAQQQAEAKKAQDDAKKEADAEKAAAKAEAAAEKEEAKKENEAAKEEARKEKDEAKKENDAAKEEAKKENEAAKEEARKEKEEAKKEQQAAKEEAKKEQEEAKREAVAEKAAAKEEQATAKEEARKEKEQALARNEQERDEAKQEQQDAKKDAERAQEEARRDSEREKQQARLEAERAKADAQSDYQQQNDEARAERESAEQEADRQEAAAKDEYEQEKAEAQEQRDEAKEQAEEDRADARREYDREIAGGTDEQTAREHYDDRIAEIDAKEQDALRQADAAEAEAKDNYNEQKADAQAERDQARADAQQARRDARAEYDQRMGDIQSEYDRIGSEDKDIDELIRQRIADLPEPPDLTSLGPSGAGSMYSSAFNDNLYNQDDLASALGRPQGADSGASSGAAGGGGAPMMPPMMRGAGGGEAGGTGERVRNVIEPGVSRPGRLGNATPTVEGQEHNVVARGSQQATSNTPFMPPMGGGGPGGGGGQQTESSDRERTTWLAEDEDVWGTDEGGAPQALGR